MIQGGIMNRFVFGLMAALITVLGTSGCGSGATVETPAPPGTEAPPAVQTPAATESAPVAPAESSQAPEDASWTTVATLSSSQPSMKGYEGILVSDPFLASGEAQLVLDMPDADGLAGVGAVVMPAEWATDPSTILDKLLDERTINVTLVAGSPPEQLGNLDGTYVIIVVQSSVIGDGEWTVQLQTR